VEDQIGKDRENNDPERLSPSLPGREDFRPRIDFDSTALEAEERHRQAEKDKPVPLTYSTPAQEEKEKRDAMQEKVAKIEEKILSGEINRWIRVIPLSLFIISIIVGLFLSRFGVNLFETRLIVDLTFSVIVIGLFITGWVINYRSYKK
jgi:hypothetical protein